MANQTLLLSYLLLILLQTLHVFEEIAFDIFEIEVGPLHMSRNRYLLAASVLSTLTVLPLALLLYDLPLGYYLGLLTSGVVGTLQGVVHVAGFLKTRTLHRSVGAGLYSAIPLSLVGAAVFVQLLRNLPG